MTGQQEAFTHQPGEGGLWRHMLDGDSIDHHAWLRARASGQFCGNCRRCGDYLCPQEPEQIGARFDYLAVCRQPETCGYQLEAPGGRVLRRSSRHTEMPAGWWDHRIKKGA